MFKAAFEFWQPGWDAPFRGITEPTVYFVCMIRLNAAYEQFDAARVDLEVEQTTQFVRAELSIS